jgi:hypothetical protein
LFVANGAVLSVNVVAVPVQVPFSYRLNVTVPLTVEPPAVVTVALSCGSQLCAVVMLEVSCTVKHSVVLFVCEKPPAWT